MFAQRFGVETPLREWRRLDDDAGGDERQAPRREHDELAGIDDTSQREEEVRDGRVSGVKFRSCLMIYKWRRSGRHD